VVDLAARQVREQLLALGLLLAFGCWLQRLQGLLGLEK